MIIDYIPNHTSDQHVWFKESTLGGDNNPYADFYIWHKGVVDQNGNVVPPNNWVINPYLGET